MTKNGSSKALVDKLIAQDTGVSESQFEEFRMNLERSLDSLEQQARSSRAIMISSVVVVIVCYAFALLVNLTPTVPWPHKILAPVWSTFTIIAMITAGVSAIRYWSKHRPALERGRTDLQIAMFSEVQRQIAQLSERLDKQAKP